MMKGRIDSKMLFSLGLLLVLMYCIIRVLGAVAASPESAVYEDAHASPGELELLLHDLEQNIADRPDSLEACSTLRDPLVESKSAGTHKVSSQGQKQSSSKSSTKSKPKLTGLVLDENPVGIVEIKGESFEVEVGDLLDGKKVIHIDERGVHVLDGEEVVIIR